MSATPEGEADHSSPHLYFVAETGDGVIFDGKGRVLVGTGKVQDYFTVGKPYGTYHTRKRPPMSAVSIKNRKVED